jgi:formimidoylglutamate deiminase
MMDRKPNRPQDPREARGNRDDRGAFSRPATAGHPAAAATAKFGVPHGATESGWLPDVVYTGEKFETGTAFFADALGRITRFSREPADLAMARRLQGQAALPGLVNTHSHAFHRVLRGRSEKRGRAEDPRSAWREAMDRVTAKLTDEDVFDTARMVFLEMLLGGITCVGEFHYLHHQPDGTPWPDAHHLSREIIRAAHEVGIRIALLKVAFGRGTFRGDPSTAPARFRTGTAEEFVRETEQCRLIVEKEFPADEAWLGIGAQSLAHLSLEQVKAVSGYARTQRMRFHAHVSTTVEENAACVAEYGRTPVALLAEHGIVDKRFTANDALHLTDDEVKLLGAARATVCACPIAEHNFGLGVAPIEKLIAAGAGVAFGTDSHVQTDLLKDARLLEYHLRVARQSRAVFAPDVATALFHAATVTGARSLGATSGALEVGRPADFFTVNLFDPSIAGAEPDTLLANIVFSLERRAIRDVWVGARQRVANGRPPLHGPVVGRFVDAQRRLWTS